MGSQSKDSKKPLDTPTNLEKNSGESLPTKQINVDSKKIKLKNRILIGLAIVLVIVIAAVIAFILFVKVTTHKITEQTTPTRFDSPQTLVDTAKTNLKGKALPVVSANGIGGITKEGYYAYSLASTNVSGTQYYSQPTEGSGVGYASDSNTATLNYQKLTDFFKANHFKLVLSHDGDSGYISPVDQVTFVSYSVYESDNLLCSLSHVDASQTTVKNHITYVSCATNDSYKKASSAYSSYFAAYTKVNKTSDATSLTFGDPIVHDGAGGYKNTILYQDDANHANDATNSLSFFQGLYYQAPGTQEWVFFTTVNTNDNPLCSQFNTDVLKKAFAGINCIDDTTKKLVTVQ